MSLLINLWTFQSGFSKEKAVREGEEMIDFNSDAKEEEVACNLQNPFFQSFLVSRRRMRKTKRRRRMMGRTYRFCWTRPTFRQAAPIHFMDQQQLKILTNIISSRHSRKKVGSWEHGFKLFFGPNKES